MEGKIRSRIWMKIIVIIFLLSVITSQSGLFKVETTADSSSRSTRGLGELNWTQTTQMDFMNGTISDNASSLVITPTGEVKLALESRNVKDDFTDESKISFKKNISVDTSVGEAKLLRIIAKTFGEGGNDVGYSVKQTSDNGYIIAGKTSYDGSGFTDIWLIKTDNLGNELWNKRFGGDWNQQSKSVEQTSDGGYIIGGFTAYSGGIDYYDAWVIKTDSYGNKEWDKTYGGSDYDVCNSLKLTSDGGYVFAGHTKSFGEGNYDVWLVKINNSGNESWNRTFGHNGYDFGKSTQQTDDGGYIIAGETEFYGAGEYDVWLIKTDSLGNEQWNRTFGGSNQDRVNSVCQTSDNGYIITGYTSSFGPASDSNLWLVKTDEFGNEQWNKTFGESGYNVGNSVKQTSDYDYIITGYTPSNKANNTDLWLIKTDEFGNELWNKTFCGTHTDTGFDVQETSDKGYVIVGETFSYDAWWSDVWLIKTDANGDIHPFSGELISKNLLEDHGVYLINTFGCYVSLPPKTSIKIQFSKDNISWYNSSGVQNDWDILSAGTNHIDLSYLAWLSWPGPNFYYKMNFTSNTTNAPILQSITVSFYQYFPSGTLESEVYDSNTFPHWKLLNWTATVPPGTELKFQLRTADSLEDINQQTFVGPNGSSETFYNTSGQSIWEGHERDRFIQYKAYLSTSNTSVSPILEEVSITYEPIDTDGDGIVDFEDEDDDNDDIPDTWESLYGFDPLNQSDANLDPDFDGLLNLQEYLNYSNPNNSDTDGDNLGDGFEVIFSKTNASLWDTNGNGIGDGLEFMQSQGYLGWIQSLPDDWIGMTISWENYTIFVKTNSSVLEGEFDKAERKLKIRVAGPNGTSGVTEMDVPKSLCEPEDIEIELDGELINYTLTENASYYHIHIEYNHSVHELIADFSRATEVLIEPETKEKGWPFYLIALVIIAVIVILILVFVIRNRGAKEDFESQELPPEKLSMMLEKKYAEGRMADETYEDIKSLLEKYREG